MINFYEKNRTKINCLVAFLISSFLMFLIFLFNNMNGKDFLFMRSDYIDSIGAIKNTVYNIVNHDYLYFNNTKGLGINDVLTIADVFSPFNLLYLIFYKSNFDIITGIIIILEVGLSAFSFQLFSHKILNNNKFIAVLISVFYALNGYSIAYGTISVSWLEVFILLPLFVISLVNCIENNKRVVLILLYAYLFSSNYYFGYMVGIFTFIFVILFLSFKLIYEKILFKTIIRDFFNWVLSVLIAVMLSAFIWVPTLFFLGANRVPDSTELIKLNVSLLQILNSLFWGISYGIEGTYGYIYCGIPIIILVPLFFINKKISFKTKLFSSIIVGILFISMVSNRLNTIWHVFDQPDDFWYRYSFLVCFSLCSLASIELNYLHEHIFKDYIYVFLGALLFYQIMLHTTSLWEIESGVLNTNYGFIINFLLILFWCIIFNLYVHKGKLKILVFSLCLLIMSFELITNSQRIIKVKTDSRTYYAWMNDVENKIDEIRDNDSSFYRMIIGNNNSSYNIDTYFGYYGIGDFGNQEKYGVRKFLSNIGFAASPRVTSENGYNPVSNMILGVKYIINSKPYYFRSDSNLINDIDFSAEDDSVFEDEKYIKNDYTLGLGYLVKGDVLLYEYPGRNVFENMNELVSSMSGLEENCFIRVSLDDCIITSDGIQLAQMDDGSYVLSRLGTEGELKILLNKEKYKEAYIQFEKNDFGIYGKDYYIISDTNSSNPVTKRLGVSYAIRMEDDSEEDYFSLRIGSYEGYSPEYNICDDINVYYFNEDALKKHYEVLSSNQLMVSSFKNGHIEGTVNIDDDRRMLFTTIPYDPGWKVYINDVETEPIRLIDGAFIGVLFPNEGEYNVVFDFECPGLKIGILVSICGLLALLSVIFEKRLISFKKKN